MKLAIEGTSLQAHLKTGIFAYTQGMVEGLSRINREDEFFLLGRGIRVKPEDLRVKVGNNFKRIILPIPDRKFWGDRILWDWLLVSVFCSVRGVDVFWQPAGHRIPVWGKFKKVITIHDLRSVHLKDDILPQDLEGLKDAVRRADGIVCISEFTKRDVIEHLGGDENKIRVIYNGVDEFRRVEDEVKIDDFRERYGLDRDFLFSLGMVPRKNVKRSIEAFSKSGLVGEVYLVFAGADAGHLLEYKALARDLGIEEWVRFYRAVPDEDLPLFYSCAVGFVFPSLFEGFGLPVLEAQMCGCPVMTSNVSALPEVVGDSAILVNPYSVEEIASAMEKLVRDEELRRELVEKGYRNVKRFSWEKSARELLRLFRELVGS